MSLNISEDVNSICYLTTDIIEPTENFEEWLKTNELVVVNNEMENTPEDGNHNVATLNQTFIDLECDLPEASGSEEDNVKILSTSDLNYRIAYLLSKWEEGLQVVFFIHEQKWIRFCDLKNNEIDFPKLTLLSGRKDKRDVLCPKEDTTSKVKYIERILLAENLNVFLPCVVLETGLKLSICPKKHCDVVYTDLSKAKIHALQHIDFKPFKCSVPKCGWEFSTNVKLKRHLYTHNKTKDFFCDEVNCGKKFSNVSNLRTHSKIHRRVASFHCSVETCNQVFQTHRLREQHLKEHDRSEAPYKCPQCNKNFFLPVGLKSHSKIHLYSISEITCNYPNCGKVFPSPCRLKEHKRVHTGQRPYVCTFDNCKWSFATASKLRRHQTTHLGERKFHCTIGDCKKSFMRSEHLKQHTLTHIDPREFKCRYCKVNYLDKHSLEKHVKEKHLSKNKGFCARAVPYVETLDEVASDILLEQAIQSLGVPSDTMLGTGLIPEESLEMLDNKNFSTVNLRDLD